MKIIIDTHTHSTASGHAYSSIEEMVRGAKKNGMKMFAVADHGPAMKGAPYLYHFGNLKVIPQKINGVRILKGAEVNIIDYNGGLDLPVEYLERLEFIMASFHDICIPPSTIENHTRALIKVAENPYIDALAHTGNPQYTIDIDMVVRAVKENGKAIEINNSSFSVRTGSDENCRNIALKCIELEVPVVCGSDAHISFDVGKFDKVYQLFKEIKMPEKLILNASMKRFEQFMEERAVRKKMR